MKIDIDGGGKLTLGAPQQRWVNDPSIDDGSWQNALFAGQRMSVRSDDAGGFELTYLNFKAGGFASMAAAKQSAPEFAKRVLARMSDMVAG